MKFVKTLGVIFGLVLLCLFTGCSRDATSTATAKPEAAAGAAPDKVWKLYSDVFGQELRGEKASEAVLKAMGNHPPIALIRLSPVQRPARGARGGVGQIQGMRLAEGAVLMGGSLAEVLRYAYDLDPKFPQNRIVIPTGTAFTRYDYVDTMPQGGREVLQQALKKQFGLVARKDMRRNLVLTVKKSDAGLHKHSEVNSEDAAKFKSKNVTMSELAKGLSKHLGVNVTDQTGLAGGYDYSLDMPHPPTADDVRNAVEDQLGLQLSPAADGQEIEFLVAEKVE